MISLKLIYKEKLSQSHKITQIGFNQIIYSFYCPQERYEWLVEAKKSESPTAIMLWGSKIISQKLNISSAMRLT